MVVNEEEEYQEKLGLYQIYVIEKDKEKFILDLKVIAFNEEDAIVRAGVGKTIEGKNLNLDDIYFFIRQVGFLYEDAFNKALVKSR